MWKSPKFGLDFRSQMPLGRCGFEKKQRIEKSKIRTEAFGLNIDSEIIPIFPVIITGIKSATFSL